MEMNIQINSVQSQPAQDAARRPDTPRVVSEAQPMQQPNPAQQPNAVQPSAQASDAPIVRSSEPAGVGDSLRDELQGLADRLSEFAAENARELKFEVGGESNRVVIIVRNPETDEVLRTIPPEEAGRIAANLNEGGSALLSQIA